MHSHISYLITLWGFSPTNKLNTLKILQNRIIKVLYNIPYRTHTVDVYKNTHIFKFESQLQFSSCLMIHKILKNTTHSNTKIITNKDIHSYNTRNCTKAHSLSKQTTTYGINSCLNRSLKNYNNLKDEIRNCGTIHQFKSKLTSLIWQEFITNTNN